MSYNWTNKGTEKHEIQKIIFEHYFKIELMNFHLLYLIQKMKLLLNFYPKKMNNLSLVN